MSRSYRSYSYGTIVMVCSCHTLYFYVQVELILVSTYLVFIFKIVLLRSSRISFIINCKRLTNDIWSMTGKLDTLREGYRILPF